MSAFHHVPVLLAQVLELLSPCVGDTVLDLTLGGGGHAHALAQRVRAGGVFYGLDRDPEALAAAKERLFGVGPVLHLGLANFGDLDVALGALGAKPVSQGGGADVVLADLGVSSHQLDTPGRGFSFKLEAPLDMRMGASGETAAELLKRLKAEELADVLFHYGDLHQSRRLARELSAQAQAGNLESTKELAHLCEQLLGAPRPGQIHPATRVFQALRIAVNDEFGSIERMLLQLPAWCKAGARVGIITFHSGEDRRIKQCFRAWETPCVCPKSLPYCVCGKKSLGRCITRKAVEASSAECAENPRARSAKLRVFRFSEPEKY